MAMSLEQRKAKDAERKRVARAAARAVRDAARTPASDAPPSTVMADAVATALTAMKWLEPSDDAAVAQAKMLAATVDRLQHAGEESKALSAHRALTVVLNDLGGTPTVRLQRELRSQKLTKSEVPHGSRGEEAAGNVSKFERPPKRKRQA